MQLRGDVVCMEGAYVDVVTGKLTSSYFEAGFDAFYGLVAGLDWCRNDRLVDFLIKLVDSGGPEASVTFYDDIEVLESMVFRLSRMVCEGEDGKDVDCGFFIEDGYPADGTVATIYAAPLLVPFGVRREKKGLFRKAKIAMGHLFALAIRYMYYDSACRYGLPGRKALEYAGLEDRDVFNAARGACRLIEELRFENSEI